MINKNTKFTLIHIGKCGGYTVESFLKNNNFKFESIHIQKCTFDINKKYVIVIRNPISRFISAFNWRYKLVVDDKIQEKRFQGEKDILQYYSSSNNLSENIHTFDINKTYIHHIKEDIDFYIGEFLQNCKKENIIGIIMTETLNNDILELFGINNIIHNNNNNTYNKTMSNEGHDNLKQYLWKDYACIDKLFEMGLLSLDKYMILSK